MNKPIHDNQINKVLLKPRFRIEVEQGKNQILDNLKIGLKKENCNFRSQIADMHVIIDVPQEDEHYWSPQLTVEVIKEDSKTIVKGLLSPKPKVWTFFMFLHFVVAISFFVFLVMFYTQYKLNQEYKFAMIMCIAMPIVWIILYLVGQFGKKLGYEQMLQLHNFLIESLNTKV
jgi:Na+/melibiose symporter-like transporter